MAERDENAEGDAEVARRLLAPAPEKLPQELVPRILQRVRAALLASDLIGLATGGVLRVFASFGHRTRAADPPPNDRSHDRSRLG